MDTSAWIELFIKSQKGKRVYQILASEECYTSIVSIAEVVNWCIKERQNVKLLVSMMSDLSHIIKIDEEISMLAGKLNFERKLLNKKWGMIDSLILATSTIRDLKVLTKDFDFKDLPGVEMLAERG